MAFNPDAFNAGLGGILQQILASRQQTQAMQQKRLDEEVPMYNQQRAWQKEDADNAYAQEVRNHERDLRPGQVTGQRLELQGLRGRNEGQTLTNQGLQTNNDITTGTKASTIATANSNAGIAASNAKILGNQATLTDAQTPLAIADAGAAQEKRRLAFLAQIGQNQRELQKELSVQTGIMLDPRKTYQERQAAKVAYTAAYNALGSLHGPTNLRMHQLEGGIDADFYKHLGFDPTTYTTRDAVDENGNYSAQKPPPPDTQRAYNGIYKSPSDWMIQSSSTGPEAKEIMAQVAKEVTDLYRGDSDIKSTYPRLTPGTMPQMNQFTHKWLPGNQIERWISGNGLRNLFQSLSENGIDARNFFKQRFNIELTKEEFSKKTLGKENKGLFKQRFTFTQPKEVSDDIKERGVEVGRLLTVLNDLYTAKTNSTVSKNNLAAALTSSFDTANKMMLGAFNKVGGEIQAKANEIGKLLNMRAESVIANLSTLKANNRAGVTQLVGEIESLQKRLIDASPYIAGAGDLEVSILQGDNNARKTRQDKINNAIRVLGGTTANTEPSGGGSGNGGTPRGGAGGATRGGAAAGSTGAAQVEPFDFGG
jgi:hypothetical protein